MRIRRVVFEGVTQFIAQTVFVGLTVSKRGTHESPNDRIVVVDAEAHDIGLAVAEMQLTTPLAFVGVIFFAPQRDAEIFDGFAQVADDSFDVAVAQLNRRVSLGDIVKREQSQRQLETTVAENFLTVDDSSAKIFCGDDEYV